MDYEKLKVVELREELSNRGLDTKGTKPILIARLREYMEQQGEGGEDVPKDESAMEVEDDADAAPVATEEPAPVATPVEPVKAEPVVATTPVKAEPVVATAPVKAEPVVATTPVKAASPAKPVVATKSDEPAKVKETTQPEEKASNGDDSKESDETAATNEEAGKPAEGDAAGEHKGVKRKRNEEEPFVVVEDEPEIDESLFCLDWYNSDLSLKIDKATLMSAEPLHKDGWGYVWSGARATHGFISGKAFFEVKLLANLEAKLGDDEKNVHELRVGFSTDDTDMQLGESANSFAYAGSAKKGTDSKFEEYGVEFTKDDVVGAYINLECDPIQISFTKNGEAQGTAFEVAKSQLAGKALFPHISTRNVKFEVNFGKGNDGTDREAWFAPLEGFTCVAAAPNLVRGSPRIAKREDCEMIMLVGLPGSGKTTWANKHVAENPDKKYTVIGTSSLIDKMKVNGEARKKHFSGNWQVLIQRSTRCLQEWLRIASQRRRNFIIDQTNVYANAQRRKIRPFQGMIRKAVVIVPSDEDYKARIEAQEKAEVKEVPDNAVMEMKANFALPQAEVEGEEIPLFKEVIFTELDREEAAKVVEEYNKDAKEKGFGKRQENQQRKRPRGNLRMMKRGGPGMRGGPGIRGMPFGRFQRGGMPFQGMMSRGFMRGGQMRGAPMRGAQMRGGPFGGPRGNRRGNFGPGNFPRGGMGGPAGMGGRGGNRGSNFAGPNMGGGGGMMGGRGGANPRFGGNNKFGGGAGRGSMNQGGMGGGQYGSTPWQQPALQRPAGWGSPWSQGAGPGPAQSPGNVWNQNMRPQQWNQGNGNFGGPAWNSGFNNQQGGYPGNQNWGGFNR